MTLFVIGRLLLAALPLGAVAACTRYETVEPVCPAPEPEASHSSIAWQRTGPPGAVTGRVVTFPDATPLRDAQVRVRTGGSWTFGDSLGRVVIHAVHAGTDTLVVQRIGYVAVSTRIDVRDSTGVAFLAVMAAVHYQLTDGCGFIWPVRRKPWWKLW